MEVRERSGLAVFVAADPGTGGAPLTVKFGARGIDPDGPEDEIAYLWDFGDGTGSQFGEDVSHTYRTPGTYTAKVTGTDRQGAFGTAEVTIVVEPKG